MQQIIVGNIISFAAAVMLFLGCCTTDTRKIYGYQIAENGILCLSSLVFGSYSGVGNFVSGYFPECSVDERSIYQELDDRA